MGNSHVFAGDYKKLFLGLSQTVNRFCNFIVKRQRLKVIESREKNRAILVLIYFKCKQKECTVKVKLIYYTFPVFR